MSSLPTGAWGCTAPSKGIDASAVAWRILAVSLSAIAFALAQPPWPAGVLAAVALVPWLLTLRTTSVVAGATSGFVFGILAAALATPWLPGTLHALGAPVTRSAGAWLLITAWGVGAPWAAFGGLAGASRAMSGGRRIGFLAAGAILIDATRSYSTAGIPWLLFGHSQVSVPGVAQMAVLGGVPLISGLLVAINVAIAELLGASPGEPKRQAARWAGGLLGSYAALACLGLPCVERFRSRVEFLTGRPLDVLVVQPNLEARARWSPLVQRTNLAIVSEQTARELTGGEPPDLVLWPETMLTRPLESDPELERELRAAVDRFGVPLVLGSARSSRDGEASRYRNSALWVEPGRGVIAAFDKTRALPLVESSRAFPGGIGLAALMGLAPGRPLVEEGDQEAPLRGRIELPVALCAEILSPGLVAARRSPGSPALVNLADDSWFAGEAAARQAVAFASFRAIEQRLWVVRAAHRGLSAVIDPYGRTMSGLRFGETGALRATLTPVPPPLLLERAALAVLWVAGALTGALVAQIPVPISSRSPA